MPPTCLKGKQKLQLSHHVCTIGWDAIHLPETNPSTTIMLFFTWQFWSSENSLKGKKRKKTLPEVQRLELSQEQGKKRLKNGCWAGWNSSCQTKWVWAISVQVGEFPDLKGKEKWNWTSANSRTPGSSCWVHRLFPKTLVQQISVLSSLVLPLPDQKTLKLHHTFPVSQVLCPRLSIAPTEISLVSHTVNRTLKPIAWLFPDYIVISQGSLWSFEPQWHPWAQVTFQVKITFLEGVWASCSFSLPCVRQESFRPGGQPHSH